MPDSNAGRDKALENIARVLEDIAGTLNKIEKNTRPSRLSIGPADPFDVSQQPQPEVKHEPAGPFVQSSHPYFKPSTEEVGKSDG